MVRLRGSIFLLTIFIFMITIALAVLHGQVSSGAENQLSPVEGQEPIANYEETASNDPKDKTKRRAKNGRFNKNALNESPNNKIVTVIRGDWLERLPALPVSLSDSVIVGTVTNATAYLSENKTGIFSEFNILIEEVIKNNKNSSLLAGQIVTSEREGGRVRYLSGRIQRYRFIYQGMPLTGRRYVFFLKTTEEGNPSPYILTAYELRDGRVSPVDGLCAEDGQKLPQFANYDGVAEVALLNELRNTAIQSNTKEAK